MRRTTVNLRGPKNGPGSKNFSYTLASDDVVRSMLRGRLNVPSLMARYIEASKLLAEHGATFGLVIGQGPARIIAHFSIPTANSRVSPSVQSAASSVGFKVTLEHNNDGGFYVVSEGNHDSSLIPECAEKFLELVQRLENMRGILAMQPPSYVPSERQSAQVIEMPARAS